MITSLQNPRIKEIVKLRTRRARDRSGDMIIDGGNAIALAIKNGFRVSTVYSHGEEGTEEILSLARERSIELCHVTEEVFTKISYGNVSRGFVALALKPDFNIDTFMQNRTADRYIIAVSFEKPGNIGALLRSADAAGNTAVIAAGALTDIYNPNVARSSLGALFTVPTAVVRDEAEAAAWLKDRGVNIYAAVPDNGADLFGTDLSGPCAFAIGNEHSGLSGLWTEDPEIKKISIPMSGQIDSLNAAQTATILIFESLRQSRQKDAK